VILLCGITVTIARVPFAVATSKSDTNILEYAPVEAYWQLTVNVVDATNKASISGAFVDVEGQGSYNEATNSEGQALFPAVLAGKNSISVSRAGYILNSITVDLTSNTTVTLQLTRTPLPTPTPMFTTIFLTAFAIIVGAAILASMTMFLVLMSFDRLRRRRKGVSRRQETESSRKTYK
jgi:hypothetical protein